MSHLLGFVERFWDGLDHVRPLGYRTYMIFLLGRLCETIMRPCHLSLSFYLPSITQSGNEVAQDHTEIMQLLLKSCTPCAKVLKIMSKIVHGCSDMYSQLHPLSARPLQGGWNSSVWKAEAFNWASSPLNKRDQEVPSSIPGLGETRELNSYGNWFLSLRLYLWLTTLLLCSLTAE